jgi:hypothetical protein
MLTRIDDLQLQSTYTKAGILRHLQLEGSFNDNMKILELMLKTHIVVVKDGYYIINRNKIKQTMGRFK